MRYIFSLSSIIFVIFNSHIALSACGMLRNPNLDSNPEDANKKRHFNKYKHLSNHPNKHSFFSLPPAVIWVNMLLKNCHLNSKNIEVAPITFAFYINRPPHS